MFLPIGHGINPAYYLDEAGQVYNSITKKTLTGSRGSYNLVTVDGDRKTLSRRKLVNMVFGEDLISDHIERLPGEEFIVVAGSGNKYFISNMGRLLSYQRKEAAIMTPAQNTNSRGYLRTVITIDGKPQNKLIHLLVAEAFCNKPEGSAPLQCHHKNFDRLDNRADNLEWLTPEEHQKKHLERMNQQNGLLPNSSQSASDNCKKIPN